MLSQCMLFIRWKICTIEENHRYFLGHTWSVSLLDLFTFPLSVCLLLHVWHVLTVALSKRHLMNPEMCVISAWHPAGFLLYDGHKLAYLISIALCSLRRVRWECFHTWVGVACLWCRGFIFMLHWCFDVMLHSVSGCCGKQDIFVLITWYTENIWLNDVKWVTCVIIGWHIFIWFSSCFNSKDNFCDIFKHS